MTDAVSERQMGARPDRGSGSECGFHSREWVPGSKRWGATEFTATVGGL